VVTEVDVPLGTGHTLHAYDTGGEGLVVVWHHGTPNIGAPPEPLVAAADELGVRWVSYDRPGYGGSTPQPDRPVGSAAGHVAAVADALGIERFAVMGHSGGGPHAVACGALLADRVVAVASIAGLAPFDAEGLDWFAGMVPSGEAALRAAAAGRAAKEAHESEGGDYDPGFTPADLDALDGPWSWLGTVVSRALESGLGPAIDDDLAYVSPWGFDPAELSVPALFVHGERDGVVPSSHSEWLSRRCPDSGLWLRPDDGHISVLASAEDALRWLRATAP
jgi:pimeloyl-ACP methyl ester carboxylesterase